MRGPRHVPRLLLSVLLVALSAHQVIAPVLPPYPCEEATETAVPRGNYPHFLPGKSPLPALNPKLTDRFGTPYDARLGGADTMSPEYINKMKSMPRGTGYSEVDLGQ